MAQNKLQRFADIKTFENVLERPPNMAGQWHTVFKNNNPIILELACGKGEYAIGLGQLYPNKNFIGVDIKGNRLWVGAKYALAERLPHIAFLRTEIEIIDQYFSVGEVSEIWITFPDPQLRNSKAKKRLTHPHFLRLYQHVLKDKGVIHLKTDSPLLYAFTKYVIEVFELNLVQDIEDVYAATAIHPTLTIKTHYEGLDIAKSNRVHYLSFMIDKPLDKTKDTFIKEWRYEETVN